LSDDPSGDRSGQPPPLGRGYRALAWLSAAAFALLFVLGVVGAWRETGDAPGLSIDPGDHIRGFAAREDWPRVQAELEAQLRIGLVPGQKVATLTQLGRILALQGATDIAILRLGQALALEPSAHETRRLLIEVLVAAGRHDQVIVNAQEYLRIVPTATEVAQQLAVALERSGRTSEAADVRARFTERGPGAAELPCTELVQSGPAARNLVFVVSDTMRRDRVGAYGSGDSTPAFDRFASGHLRFDRAVSPASWTKPAIASLFTGLVPSHHGLLEDPRLPILNAEHQRAPEANVLPRDIDTLAEALEIAGFRTAAIVANPWLAGAFGFDQGFGHYDDAFARFDAPGRAVTERGLAWLEGLPPDTPYFLYLHYIDAHQPYGAFSPDMIEAARGLLDRDARPVPAEAATALAELRTTQGEPLLESTGLPPKRMLLEVAYDAGIANFDAAFGTLLAALEARDDWDQTSLVVTSDHGEAFYERGYGNHARALHEDELSLPLAARLPGIAPTSGTVSCTTSLVDWRSTLCQYFGLECAADDGQSLLPDGAREDRYVLAEGVPGFPEHRSVQNRRYKLIYEPGGRLGPNLVRDEARGREHPFSLFDLVVDPKERTDLLADPRRQESIAPVFASLRAALEAHDPSAAPVTRAPLDAATRERLEALGYLGGKATTP
jgi:arylsulfatase